MSGPLILAREQQRAGLHRKILARQAERGTLVRLRQGVYVPADEWEHLAWWEQYLLQIEAAAVTSLSPKVFTLQSAAAIWGIPFFGMQNDVHVIAGNGAHGRLRAGIRTHRNRNLDDPVLQSNRWTTSRAQTVVELAVSAPFEEAVAAADHVLKTDKDRGLAALSKDAIFAVADRLDSRSKFDRAARVIEIADARSGSPGESLSRADMYLKGFPKPELQYRVETGNGSLIGISDFYWEDLRLLGEYDGSVKYSRNEYLKGRLPPDVLEAEKAREDSMRATARGMVRWTWPNIWSSKKNPPATLSEKLTAAGLAADSYRNSWGLATRR